MKGRVVPIAIAIVLALLAGVIVFFLARGADERALGNEQPVDILVAASLIPKGTALQDAVAQGLVQTTQVPAKLQPAGSVTAVTAENGPLLATADIPAGQVIFAGAFAATVPDTAAVAPLEVPDGLMAISVPMEDPNKVGTFLRPGSMIAVFETIAVPGTDPKAAPTQATRMLIDRAEVLAIGTTAAAGATTATPDAWAATLVTIAVDQVQAEKIIQARQSGTPYFALLGDNTTLTPSAGVSDADLFN